MTAHGYLDAVRLTQLHRPLRPASVPKPCPASAQPCPNYPGAPSVCEPCAAQRIPTDLRAAS